jgi:hypothetical protein
MAAIKNPKHEKFALLLFEGKPQNQAYALAGYQFHEGNASRLRSSEKVCARLSELQAVAQKSSEVTVQSLLAELESARERATTKDQLSAAVRAIEAKAKVSGLMTQKIKVVDPAQDFEHAETYEQIAAALARGIAQDKHYQLTPDELKGFADLIKQWVVAIDQYLCGCAARPVPQIRQSAFNVLLHPRIDLASC